MRACPAAGRTASGAAPPATEPMSPAIRATQPAVNVRTVPTLTSRRSGPERGLALEYRHRFDNSAASSAATHDRRDAGDGGHLRRLCSDDVSGARGVQGLAEDPARRPHLGHAPQPPLPPLY